MAGEQQPRADQCDHGVSYDDECTTCNHEIAEAQNAGAWTPKEIGLYWKGRDQNRVELAAKALAIEDRIERLEDVAERWDVPGGSRALARRARDKAEGLRVAQRILAADSTPTEPLVRDGDAAYLTPSATPLTDRLRARGVDRG